MMSKDFEKNLRDIAVQSDPVEEEVPVEENSEFKKVIELKDISVQADFVPTPKMFSNFGAQVEFDM